MRYRITGMDGRDSVEVDAVDWMMAMSKAIQMFGIEVSGWVCDTRSDGQTVVTDPASGLSWLVQSQSKEPPELSAPPPPSALSSGAPPPLPSWLQQGAVTPKTISPLKRKVGLTTLDGSAAPASRPPANKPPTPANFDTGHRPAPPPTGVFKPVAARAVPPATGVMSSEAQRTPNAAGAPSDLAERLFEVSMDIAMAEDVNSACSVALQIALDLVPCEAGSVLRGGINESELKFVAVSGPAASKLLGRSVPFGHGIAGATFDMGITIQVNDVAHDARHDSKYDEETGFHTRSVLCVPVRTQTNFFGCLQLLNPPQRFEDWHVEVAETVARSLSATLEAALA